MPTPITKVRLLMTCLPVCWWQFCGWYGPLSRGSTTPSAMPNSRCRHVAAASARRLPGQGLELAARGMEAVDQAPQRPEAEVLDHRRSDRLCERRTWQMRARERVGGAERRAVRRMDKQAERSAIPVPG